MDAVDHDVLVVGYGPVGQVLSILLAQRGHRVGVVERWPEPYPQPRAVHFDHEIARILAVAGVAEQVAAISHPSRYYDWQNADGRTLIQFDWGGEGPSAWPTSNIFSQPDLERVLAGRVESLPNVEVRRGETVVALDEQSDLVIATVESPSGQRVVSARYVVGCDGANSFVRQRMGTSVTDLGFFYDWLIVDTVPHVEREWRPPSLQICDPARPTTVISGGPGRRRWEFMRLPHETVTGLNTEETAWRLLAPWDLSPDNCDLERHTVYTFQARWADTWRQGRLLIAGDAAHLMPPFAGQGMCSGIRDAANLAWKLDLVLSTQADDELLDTYGSERSAHVQNAIGMSVELGNIICMTDPAQAAARDEQMLKAEGRPELALPPVPPPVLGPGVLHSGPDGSPVPPAGELSWQGRVIDADGRAGRLDEVVGTGWVVLTAADPTPALTDDARSTLTRLGAVLVHVTAGAAPRGSRDDEVRVVRDVDGSLLPRLRAAGHEILVIRPDFYVFGAGTAVDDLPSLLTELIERLHLRQPAGHPAG